MKNWCGCMHGRIQGGGGGPGGQGPPPPPPAQIYTNVDLFGFHSGLDDREVRKCLFFWGGGGGGGGGRGVSEEVKILGEASPLKLSTTKGSQKYMQISYSVTPLPESLDPPMACTQQKY